MDPLAVPGCSAYVCTSAFLPLGLLSLNLMIRNNYSLSFHSLTFVPLQDYTMAYLPVSA
jgi:hypothetical protein